jgi:dTDP-4-amino-4,6-dideoxygalactose transaminase
MTQQETDVETPETGGVVQVPLMDLAAQQAEVHADVSSAVDGLLRAASFIGGPVVSRFEDEYAGFLGARHCVGVANGTDALELALRAAGVSPGGEVILPANSFVATAEAVARIGAVPVLVDVDPNYLLIDPDRVAEAVKRHTQAIVPVHLFGQVAPVEMLQGVADASGIAIIEDAAQAQGATRHGRPAGTLGLAAGTSFYPGKNLGAAGDAGAVTTNDPELADAVRVMAAHGSSTKYVHDVVGMNSRLDAIQAVVLSAKLARLPEWNRARTAAAQRYNLLLQDLPAVQLPHSMPGNDDVWHLYVVRVGDRDRVLSALQASGIGAAIHYPTPIHLTKAFSYLGKGEGDFPVAEAAAGQLLSLPIYPHITPAQQTAVVEALRRAL